jgi:hypothetical protein
VLEDPEARQLHSGLLPPSPPEKDPMYEHHVRGLELKLLYAGPRALTTDVSGPVVFLRPFFVKSV